MPHSRCDVACAVTTPSNVRNLTNKQREAKRARDRERHARMTPDQREARRVRQNMQNASLRGTHADQNQQYARPHKTQTPEQNKATNDRRRVKNLRPEQAQAKRERKRMQREIRRNILNPGSIAMENPKFIPEVEPLNANSSSPVSLSDFVIPDFSGTPVYIQTASEQTQDATTLGRGPGHKISRRRVKSGERQSLLARRNRQFETITARRLIASLEDNEPMEDKDDNGLEPLNHTCVTTAGTYYFTCPSF